jgi:hypothetical protein
MAGTTENIGSAANSVRSLRFAVVGGVHAPKGQIGHRGLKPRLPAHGTSADRRFSLSEYLWDGPPTRHQERYTVTEPDKEVFGHNGNTLAIGGVSTQRIDGTLS